MVTLYFSDILKKAGIDPAEVKLIRHSLTDENFRNCYYADKVYEYTRHQKPEFGKGFAYWAVFIGETATLARFFALYQVGKSTKDTLFGIPEGIPDSEAEHYDGKHMVFDLSKVTSLEEFENKLIIEWGKSARSWHQNGTNEKRIVSIKPRESKAFIGYNDLVLDYGTLKDIVDGQVIYDAWRTALSEVNAIYLIVDTKTGKQYIGSSANRDGLLGRWKEYVDTGHGGNRMLIDLLQKDPNRINAFQFSVLQVLPVTIIEKEAIRIEDLWKRKLLTREFGLNKN